MYLHNYTYTNTYPQESTISSHGLVQGHYADSGGEGCPRHPHTHPEPWPWLAWDGDLQKVAPTGIHHDAETKWKYEESHHDDHRL